MIFVGYYVRRNHFRSLEFAIQSEKEWELNKPDEDDMWDDDDEEDDDEEDEEGAEEGAEEEAGEDDE